MTLISCTLPQYYSFCHHQVLFPWLLLFLKNLLALFPPSLVSLLRFCAYSHPYDTHLTNDFVSQYIQCFFPFFIIGRFFPLPMKWIFSEEFLSFCKTKFLFVLGNVHIEETIKLVLNPSLCILASIMWKKLIIATQPYCLLDTPKLGHPSKSPNKTKFYIREFKKFFFLMSFKI